MSFEDDRPSYLAKVAERAIYATRNGGEAPRQRASFIVGSPRPRIRRQTGPRLPNMAFSSF
jgi:hypothetical protein